MGKFTAEVVEGKVILRRKVADKVAEQPSAAVESEPVQTPDTQAAESAENADPKARRRPRVDDGTNG